MCFHLLGIIIPTDFHIFQRGWNHQPDYKPINLLIFAGPTSYFFVMELLKTATSTILANIRTCHKYGFLYPYIVQIYIIIKPWVPNCEKYPKYVYIITFAT